MYSVVALSVLAFLGWTLSQSHLRNLRTFLAITLLLALYAGVVAAFRFEDLENLIHFVEFSVLGGLFFISLRRTAGKLRACFTAVTLSLLFGIFSELAQLFIPDRYCDLQDMSTNAIGGFFGVILALVLQKNFLKKRI
jgi:VanZ family protein